MLFWLVVTLIFALVRLAPGDPATLLVPPSATAEDVQRLRADLGLIGLWPSNMHAGLGDCCAATSVTALR